MAKGNVPGSAGVLVYRDLQPVFDKVPGARFRSATPTRSPPPATYGGRGNLDYCPAGKNKVFEFEGCILLLAKPRHRKSAPSHAISGGLEGGEGVANVDAPGYAGVHILRDL